MSLHHVLQWWDGVCPLQPSSVPPPLLSCSTLLGGLELYVRAPHPFPSVITSVRADALFYRTDGGFIKICDSCSCFFFSFCKVTTQREVCLAVTCCVFWLWNAVHTDFNTCTAARLCARMHFAVLLVLVSSGRWGARGRSGSRSLPGPPLFLRTSLFTRLRQTMTQSWEAKMASALRGDLL